MCEFDTYKQKCKRSKMDYFILKNKGKKWDHGRYAKRSQE